MCQGFGTLVLFIDLVVLGTIVMALSIIVTRYDYTTQYMFMNMWYLTERWVNSNASTPPSSKAADVFRNNGSISNSRSKVLTSRTLGFFSTVTDVPDDTVYM